MVNLTAFVFRHSPDENLTRPALRSCAEITSFAPGGRIKHFSSLAGVEVACVMPISNVG